MGNARSVWSTIAAIGLTLLAADVLLRVTDFRVLRQDASERSLAYDYDSELGWTPAPNSSSIVTTARSIHATHNSLGLRDIEYRPDGRRVILFVGDSFVWGVDAEVNERFTDLIRERMDRFWVLNAGVSGYGTDQEFIWMKRIWSTVEPAFVVLFFCTDNDRLDNSTNVRYAGYRKPYYASQDGALVLTGQPVPKSLKQIIHEHWLLRVSWLARLACLAYIEILYPQVFVPDPTDRLLNEIQEYVTNRNARLLLALQRRDELLIAHLQSQGIPFVSLDGTPAFGPEYGAHFTPEGNRIASRRLLDFLNEQIGKQ
jgi:lysophospholipase L1-like esterase